MPCRYSDLVQNNKEDLHRGGREKGGGDTEGPGKETQKERRREGDTEKGREAGGRAIE